MKRGIELHGYTSNWRYNCNKQRTVKSCVCFIVSYRWAHVWYICKSLRWRHNDGDSVSNHQLHDCLLSCLFGRTSKKTSKPRVTGLCVGNSPGAGEFPAQMASNAENVSIWWRHHVICILLWWTWTSACITWCVREVCTKHVVLHPIVWPPSLLTPAWTKMAAISQIIS